METGPGVPTLTHLEVLDPSSDATSAPP